MNAFERAIHAYCGLVIEGIPADGKMRKFKIGQQEGYAIYFGDCGSFGNWSRQELFQWDGSKSIQLEREVIQQPLRGLALEAERKIVSICSRKQDRGEVMGAQELDRFILALQRVIEANKRDDKI